MEPSDSEEEKEPEPDAKTLEFYRIGPPVASILRKPGVPPRRLQLPERRVSFSQDVVDPPPRRRPLQRKHSTAEMWDARRESEEESRSPFIKKVSLIALCSFAMVTLVGVFWGYIIHGIVHSEGQEEKPHPPLPDKGVLKIGDEETLRNIEDSDYSVPNLVFMTAKPHRRRGATPVVVIKRYSPVPTAPYWSRAPRSTVTRRRNRKKAKKESHGERSKVLLVPAVHEVNSTLLFVNNSSTANDNGAGVDSRTTDAAVSHGRLERIVSVRLPGTSFTGKNVRYSAPTGTYSAGHTGLMLSTSSDIGNNSGNTDNVPVTTGVASGNTETYGTGEMNSTDDGNEQTEDESEALSPTVDVTSVSTDLIQPGWLTANGTEAYNDSVNSSDGVKVSRSVVTVTASVRSFPSTATTNNRTVTWEQRQGESKVLNGTDEYYYD